MDSRDNDLLMSKILPIQLSLFKPLEEQLPEYFDKLDNLPEYTDPFSDVRDNTRKRKFGNDIQEMRNMRRKLYEQDFVIDDFYSEEE